MEAASIAEQPQYPQISRGYHQGPWVRPDRPSRFAEIDLQDKLLNDWARANGFFINASEIEKVRDAADLTFGGQEHDVWVFRRGYKVPFVIRRTRNGGYGLRDRTPGEYLDRWRLSNAAFPDTAVSFIGYTKDSRGNGVFLTAQRYFEGRKRPQKVIDAAMKQLGFEKMAGCESSYHNPETKVEIHDAKPDNIIFDKVGNMIPFDVWINDPANQFGIHNVHLQLTAIVAMAHDRVIGHCGTMPWHLPADLAFFKRTTLDHPVVMGRKTYESIGKPLPRRRNIVLSRDAHWSAPNVETIHHPDDLQALPDLNGRIFIIGGAQIYQAFLPFIQEILITHVTGDFPGDTYFPPFEHTFHPAEVLESHPAFTIRRWHQSAHQE